MKAIKYITLDECEKLYYRFKALGTGYGLRSACLLWLSFHHGLRCSEALSLRWSNFTGNDNGNFTHVFISRAKGSIDGTHKLDERERGDLLQLKNWYLKRNLYADSGFVAISDNAKNPFESIHSNTWRYHLKVEAQLIFGAKRAKDLTPHSLRHGCGFYLASKGTETELIKTWLGHADIESTLIYTGKNPNTSLDFSFH